MNLKTFMILALIIFGGFTNQAIGASFSSLERNYNQEIDEDEIVEESEEEDQEEEE